MDNKMRCANKQPPGYKSGQYGLSLVEIMIALTISLFLLGGVIQVYSSTRITYRTNEGLSRLQENARFVFDRMAADLNASGFLGCNDSDAIGDDGNLEVNNLLANVTAAYDFANAVSGTEATGPGQNGANSTDQLFIRRSIGGSVIKLAQPYEQDENAANPNQIILDKTSPNFAKLQQYQIMALSDCEKTSIFMITNVPVQATGAIQFQPNVVSPTNKINAGQSNVLTNYKGVNLTDLQGVFGDSSGSTATAYDITTSRYDIIDTAPGCQSSSGFCLALNGTEFVEDVTDFQVLFGLDTDGIAGSEQFVKANNPALAAAGMNSVASLQVSLTLEAPNAMVNGQAIRKTFTQLFRLRNR